MSFSFYPVFSVLFPELVTPACSCDLFIQITFDQAIFIVHNSDIFYGSLTLDNSLNCGSS